MNGRRKKKAMLLLSVFFIFLCVVSSSAFWLHSYQQATFQHISTFCEILVKAHPETEQQVLSALKEYNNLTEQQISGNYFLAQYGYRVNEFCKGLPINIFFSFICTVFGYSLCIFYFNKKRRQAESQTNYRVDRLSGTSQSGSWRDNHSDAGG